MGQRTGAKPLDEILSKREQQVMEIIHRRGRATAGELHEAMPDAASYNAVRGILRGLEKRGILVHERDGRRFVYTSAASPMQVASSAIRHLIQTFFDGSADALVNTLLDTERLSLDELDAVQARIDEARGRTGGRSDE